jgi:hypothetical protein
MPGSKQLESGTFFARMESGVKREANREADENAIQGGANRSFARDIRLFGKLGLIRLGDKEGNAISMRPNPEIDHLPKVRA